MYPLVCNEKNNSYDSGAAGSRTVTKKLYKNNSASPNTLSSAPALAVLAFAMSASIAFPVRKKDRYK